MFAVIALATSLLFPKWIPPALATVLIWEDRAQTRVCLAQSAVNCYESDPLYGSRPHLATIDITGAIATVTQWIYPRTSMHTFLNGLTIGLEGLTVLYNARTIYDGVHRIGLRYWPL